MLFFQITWNIIYNFEQAYLLSPQTRASVAQVGSKLMLLIHKKHKYYFKESRSYQCTAVPSLAHG